MSSVIHEIEADPKPLAIDGQRFVDLAEKLCEISDKQLQRGEYYDICFNSLCESFNAHMGILNVRLGPRTLERQFCSDDTESERWLDVVDNLVLRAQTDETALVRVYRSQSGDAVAYAIAAPIFSASGKPFGSIGLVIPNNNYSESESDLVQLSQLLSLIVENAPSSQPENANSAGSASNNLRSVIRASDYQSIRHLCFAIANSLCNKLGCEQVAIGLIRRNDVKLIAVSGLSEIPKSTPGIMAVQQAMSVCFDRNEITVVQEEGRLVDQCESSPCKVHQFWHRMTQGSSVATLPLSIDGKCIAVIAIRRPANQPFVPDDLRRSRLLAESFAPALPLVDRASRSLVRHTVESTSNFVRRVYSWHGLGKKVAAGLLLLTALWFVFGKMHYEVLAPCKIVPEQVNTVAAPYDSMIAKVFVLPGQHVEPGQLLLQLDDRDLLIERSRILSEIASTEIEANTRLQNREPKEAFLLQAEIRVLKTDLTLVEEKLRRAEIRATQSGVVMPTEIHQRVGQYVQLGESLLEVANENQWHVEIETPENRSRHLAIEQKGFFQTNARPDQWLPCKITKISPSTEVIRQNNVVVAEAVLDSRAEWMKIGMEGHIRIKTEKKPVWWIYFHPVIDYARMKLWL